MSDERRRMIRDMLVIFVLALLPRLILALSLPADDSVFWDEPYVHYARNFAQGRGFWMPNPYSDDIGLAQVRAFRPPLFPFLWGCVYNFTNGAYAPIRLTFAILGAASCALAYWAGRELIRKRGVALLGGVICALYPPLIWHSVHLMTEPMFIFFSTLFILSLLRFRRTEHRGWLICAGLSAGLATLTRSVLIGFLPLAAMWLWWVRGRRLRAIFETGLFTLIVVAVMSPWIIRNAIVFRAFVPATTDAGHGFYVANNEQVLYHPHRERGFCYPKSWGFLKRPGEESVGELEASRRLMRLTSRYLITHPGVAVRLMARRFVVMWRFYPSTDFVAQKHAVIYALSYIPIFPFMLIGLWLGHRRLSGGNGRLPNLLLVDLLVLYTIVMSVLFLAMLRYRVPLMPFLLIFAALGIKTIWDRIRRRHENAKRATIT